MKIDLHVHTEHSFDCQSQLEAVIDRAVENGLDALAVTDHDNMSACGLAGQMAEEKNIVVIPAMEITVEGGTHVIGLFLHDEIISRDIIDIIAEIHEQDGLVAIPHPYRTDTGLMYNREERNYFNGEEIQKILSGVDLIEAINFRCPSSEMVKTDKMLAFFPDIPHTAGSDAHFVEEVGRAYVELEKVKSNSLNDIKKALLESPRTIRYEAYSVEGQREVVAMHEDAVSQSIFTRTKNILPNNIRKSIRSLFEKSTGRMRDT
jgi:predicted metal-dependent phosphoesterase TrpH